MARKTLKIDYKHERDTKTTRVYAEENPNNPERPMRLYLDKEVIEEIDSPDNITLTVTAR